ncbi:MAG: hypothetical protein AAGG48_08010 [Planctomycetota bacterium]
MLTAFSVSTFASAQEATYESLLAEANALPGETSAAGYVVEASRVFDQANGILAGAELQTIVGKIGETSVRWLKEESVATSATLAQANFLVERGFAKVADAEKAQVAANWIRQSSVIEQLPLPAVDQLIRSAKAELTTDERDELVAKLQGSLGDLATVSIEDLKAGFDIRVGRSFYPEGSEQWREPARKFVAAWADNHSPASLEEDDLDWVLRMMTPIGFSVPKDRKISATWSADLLPPESGEYTFSLSGVLPSPRFIAGQQLPGDAGLWDQKVSVMVDGQVVLEATSQEWKTEATPISLQSQPTSIEVSLQYSAVSAAAESAAVQLFWSGPGIEKQLIAPSFFRLEGTTDPGVALVVEQSASSDLETCTTKVVSIDHVFGMSAACDYEKTLRTYLEQRLNQLLSADAISRAVASATAADPAARASHPLLEDEQYLPILMKASGGQRKRVATELALNPSLLALIEPEAMASFYEVVRFGAEREALDLVGAWMTTLADRTPQLTADAQSYYAANCEPFQRLAVALAYLHPDSVTWLEDYLVTEEGSCCLPAAHTLAYCYQMRGELLDWMALLDTQLNDSSVNGDKRVNWLIARAVVEEIRSSPEGDYRIHIGSERLGVGFSWLNQATDTAVSADVNARVAAENAARLAAQRKWVQAKSAVEGYADLTGMIGAIDGLVAEVEDWQAARAEQANAAVVSEFRRRLSGAQRREDSSASSRYSSLIESLESDSSE